MSSGGDSIRMCGLSAFFEMRDRMLRHHEGPARVDLVHQVEAAHVGLRHRRQLDRARIVDHDVDAAELLGGRVERRLRPLPPRARRPRAAALCRRPARSPAAAVWMVPGSFGCGVSVLAAIAIFAPSRAARSAMASPMPREAPVMNNVLPLSDMRPSFPSRRSSALDRRRRFTPLRQPLKRRLHNSLSSPVCLHHRDK